MGRRRNDPEQQDLFGESSDEVVPVKEPRGVPAGYGGQPDMVMEVLNEILDGRYGVIEKTGRVVEVTADRTCRLSEVEDIVLNLQQQRYIEEGEMVACRHGAIIKPVNRFKLTKSGTTLRRRWAHLKPSNA
jgi:hypothetical protein